LGAIKEMVDKIGWYCAKCGTELLIPYQLGKGVKGRKPYCKKCRNIIKGVKK